jgi:hypothetical protein
VEEQDDRRSRRHMSINVHDDLQIGGVCRPVRTPEAFPPYYLPGWLGGVVLGIA